MAEEQVLDTPQVDAPAVEEPRSVDLQEEGSIVDDVIFGGAEGAVTEAFDREELAYDYLGKLDKRIDAVVDAMRKAKVRTKKVLLLEWLNPIYNCGHWIPHQIGLAGGVDMLSHPSGDSTVTPWEKIKQYDPEVIVIAPCGFSVERTFKEMHGIA